MWVPLALRRGATPPDERRFWYQASLKPGVTLAEASERMTAVVNARALAHPDEYPPQVRIEVLDLRYRVVGRFSNVLFTLLGAVVLLLLIACCNVANMLLARATTREREMTLRAALGGGRLRIMAHLLTESGLLALGRRRRRLPAGLGRHPRRRGHPAAAGHCREVQLRLVPEALIASLAMAVLTTMIVGIVPAWNASRQDLANGMKESGKGAGASNKHGWLRNGLVVAEVALSLVLLLGAGLLIRNFAALSRPTSASIPRASRPWSRSSSSGRTRHGAAAPLLRRGCGARQDHPRRRGRGPRRRAGPTAAGGWRPTDLASSRLRGVRGVVGDLLRRELPRSREPEPAARSWLHVGRYRAAPHTSP